MAAHVEAQFTSSEVVLLRQPNTLAFVQGKELGLGLLNIDENALSWTSDDQSEQFALEYPGISIHAISRDTSTFPHECVYLLHCPTEEEEEEEEEEENDEGVGKEGGREGNNCGKMTEIRLVPPDSSLLDAIFQAISECQTLYPDPEQLSSEEDNDEGVELGGGEEEGEMVDLSGGEFFTSPEGLEHLTPEGRVVLQHLERVFQMPTQEEFAQMVTNGSQVQEQNEQFEDAET